MLVGAGCATLDRTGHQELSVDDFSFEGPLGSDGARIEKLGPNHFLVTLGHAPNQPGWPNKLNFQILRNAAGNDLTLEVRFPGGPSYSFNEYHQSYSYDGVHWAMQEADRLGVIEPLKVRSGTPSYGAVSWSAGPHAQFGITAILCEGGAVLQTKRLNMESGVALIRSIDAFYTGTRSNPDSEASR